MVTQSKEQTAIGRCEGGASVRELDIRPTLLRRAEYLPAVDRTLVRSVLEQRFSMRELGALVGVSAGSLSRRVKQLVTRLRDPVVVALIDGPSKLELSDEQRRVGLQHYLLRRSARAIARETGMTYGEVLGTMGYVRGWAGGVRWGTREEG